MIQDTKDLEEEEEKATLKIQEPEEKFKIRTADEMKLQSLMRTPEYASYYNDSVDNAQAIFKNYEKEGRDTLAQLYKEYAKETVKDYQKEDIAKYYQDSTLMNMIGSKLNRESNAFTYLQDVKDEVADLTTLGAVDMAKGIQATKESLTPVLDANILYYIASKEKGTINSVIDNYGWGKDNIIRLQDLYQKYPDDKVIESLYNTVIKQGYSGDKDYFDATVSHINNMVREENYKNSFIVKSTVPAQDIVERLRIREQQAGYGNIPQGVLEGIGTTSYMIPSIVAGATAGNVAGNIAGKAGATIETAKNIAESANKAGTLGSMYFASSASALNDALNKR